MNDQLLTLADELGTSLKDIIAAYSLKPPYLLDEHQYSQFVSMKVSKARAMRIEGRGCKFLKNGNAVRYPLIEVLRYVQSNVVASTAASKELKRACLRKLA